MLLNDFDRNTGKFKFEIKRYEGTFPIKWGQSFTI